MMISSFQFYEDELKGKSQEEIVKKIKSLKRRIAVLKKEIRNSGNTITHQSDPKFNLVVTRKCLDMAKQAFAKTGMEYVPNRNELRAQRFDDKIFDIKEIVFDNGACFGVMKPPTIISFQGDDTLRTTGAFYGEAAKYSKYFDDTEPKTMKLEFSREEFLDELSFLHIGEWKKNYMDPYICDGYAWHLLIVYNDGSKCEFGGCNDEPYNFDDLVALLSEKYELR